MLLLWKKRTRRTPVQSNQQRFNNTSRLTPKLLEAPPDHQR